MASLHEPGLDYNRVESPPKFTLTQARVNSTRVSPVNPQLKICACPYYCYTHKIPSHSHKPAECLHEKIWKISTLLAMSTWVSRRVTWQEGLTQGGSDFHGNAYRRLTEEGLPKGELCSLLMSPYAKFLFVLSCCHLPGLDRNRYHDVQSRKIAMNYVSMGYSRKNPTPPPPPPDGWRAGNSHWRWG